MTDSTHGAAAETKQPDVKPLHPLKEFWSYFSVNTGAVIGLYFIIFVILVAVFADVISPWEPYFQNRDVVRHPLVQRIVEAYDAHDSQRTSSLDGTRS